MNLKTLAALAALAAPAVAQNLLVETSLGPVLGEVKNSVRVWQSIPFAQPPVGALRFQNPESPAPWTEVKDVRGDAMPCIQLKLDGNLLLGAEDCLYLSVYAPPSAADPNAKLPVLFWIYGGGYVLGDSLEFGIYNGQNLARKHNAIIVTHNYRLGPFGFMALNSLASENGNSTGNAALMDQLLALKWTKANIAAFGGDPSRITIFGESAGAFSVFWHLTSPLSAGLFSGAISESGTADAPQFFQTRDFAVSWNSNYANALGCPTGNGPVPDSAQLSCLRTLSAEHIVTSLADQLNPNWPYVSNWTGPQEWNGTAFYTEGLGLPRTVAPRALPALAPAMPWGPAIDGVSLPMLPLTALRKGQFNKVPVILGTNKNEGTLLLPMFTVVSDMHLPPLESDVLPLIARAFNMFGDPGSNGAVANITRDLIIPAYPPSAYPAHGIFNVSGVDTFAQGADMLTHCFFTCANRRAARALVAAGVPTYLYHFSHTLHFPENEIITDMGDYHASELVFVWDFELPIIHQFNAEDRQVSDAFGSWWTNFAASGDPNVGSGNTSSPTPLHWPPFNANPSEGEQNMEIAVPFSVTVDLEDDLCDIWDEWYAKVSALPPAPFAEGGALSREAAEAVLFRGGNRGPARVALERAAQRIAEARK